MAAPTMTKRLETPPREDLQRQAPFTLRAADDGEPGDGLTLDGYAAVFNRVTVIDSWEGRFKEQLLPGSMKKSFRERTPRLQFDHGRHPMLGSIPIGRLTTTEEDAAGAHVVGRLHDNWLVEPVRDAIESESIDGMSFRFEVVREKWQDADGKVIRDEQVLQELLRRSWMDDLPDDELLLRSLVEVKVPELGPVVWPAYEETSVAVRSKLTIDLGRLDDPLQRRTLARAVFLADAAERLDMPPTHQTDSDRHPSVDAPPAAEVSPGEHPSAPRVEAPKTNPAREFARSARGYLLTIS